MTKIDQNIYATDLDDQVTNSHLTDQGYTIRHIETWHRNGHSDEHHRLGWTHNFRSRRTVSKIALRFISLMRACAMGAGTERRLIML